MGEKISMEEAAKRTGFDMEEIEYWARRHKINSYPTSKGRLVDAENLDMYVKSILICSPYACRCDFSLM